MFSIEKGSMEIINTSISEYKSKFKQDFPLYEYLYLTREKGYDFSLVGAFKLAKFIALQIELGKPVPTPKGYNERIY